MLQVPTHKPLGFILDEKLSFTYHLKEISDKCMKTMNMLRKLSNFLQRREGMGLLSRSEGNPSRRRKTPK